VSGELDYTSEIACRRDWTRGFDREPKTYNMGDLWGSNVPQLLDKTYQ